MAGAKDRLGPNAGDIMDGAWSSSRTGGSMTPPMAAEASSPPMIHLRKVWSGASPGGAAASDRTAPAGSHPSPAPRPISSGVSCHSLPTAVASSPAAPPGHAAATGGGETFLALAPARAATPAVAASRGDDSVEAEVGGLGLGLWRWSSTEVGSQRPPAPENLPAASPCCCCSSSNVPACPSRALPAKGIPLI
uniref:Uncharacterized protein n=1 Tax=Arundo donax TaxID=35708 RepID=A0A0A9DE41_ARUDO